MKIGLQQLTDGMREQHRTVLLALEAKLIEVERQRDELLEALELLLGAVDSENPDIQLRASIAARAAIAKARGQE